MNFSSSERIENYLGPQQALSLPWLIPLTFIYVTVLILGVIGNVATILVILKFKYMQTVTNLYLCNLAITDLLILIAGTFNMFFSFNYLIVLINSYRVCKRH
ncbi:Neuromedin-U receptor 2-like protein [Leptotrombidium deliense]|uniref:Neuromedin-U receptor 2-like protein n=1 Tax=Leptotrombidium deliense TaxID=299467 RepID=A0A443S603_9ACAR|nr:Neuromedin-U receptor 2-like protein [Leptotrombidium deliense]